MIKLSNLEKKELSFIIEQYIKSYTALNDVYIAIAYEEIDDDIGVCKELAEELDNFIHTAFGIKETMSEMEDSEKINDIYDELFIKISNATTIHKKEIDHIQAFEDLVEIIEKYGIRKE